MQQNLFSTFKFFYKNKNIFKHPKSWISKASKAASLGSLTITKLPFKVKWIESLTRQMIFFSPHLFIYTKFKVQHYKSGDVLVTLEKQKVLFIFPVPPFLNISLETIRTLKFIQCWKKWLLLYRESESLLRSLYSHPKCILIIYTTLQSYFTITPGLYDHREGNSHSHEIITSPRNKPVIITIAIVFCYVKHHTGVYTFFKKI